MRVRGVHRVLILTTVGKISPTPACNATKRHPLMNIQCAAAGAGPSEQQSVNKPSPTFTR